MSASFASELVGTWRLLSRIDIGRDGRRRPEPNLGEDPIATLIYDASGHFAAQFMRRNRDGRTDKAAMPSPAPSNNSTAVNGYDAYFGRYAVGPDGTVTQTLEGALSPADVGKVVTRQLRIEGGELVIALETTSNDGEPVVRTLRWERAA